ncbi:MAG: polysaccharide biosynthesis/export family protein [Pseudomonadales bacterium]|nr:polysaccharide biosynthesis/export family protein [Pseudomonadales bacterium]
MQRFTANLVSLVLGSAVLVSGCTTDGLRPPVGPVYVAPAPVLTVVGMSEAERFARLAEIKADTNTVFALGSGDVLQISVYDEPDLTIDGITVRPDGAVSFPLVGDIVAERKTVEELRTEVTQRLGAFLKEPKVSVIVRKFTSQRYTIIGQVVKPGMYPLDTQITLTQAMARSGGMSQGQFHASSIELADLSHAFISRGGEMLPVDFVALLRAGDLRYDLPLRADDYIYIPSALSEEVYILGEVQRPDMFAFREGMPLSKALVVAKGFTNNADMSRVHVVRGSLTAPQLYVVNMDKVFRGEEQDVPLQSGDIVFIPPTGLARWADIVNKILPGMVLARTGNSLVGENVF